MIFRHVSHVYWVVVIWVIALIARKKKTQLHVHVLGKKFRLHHWLFAFVPLIITPMLLADGEVSYLFKVLMTTINVLTSLLMIVDEWDDLMEAIRDEE